MRVPSGLDPCLGLPEPNGAGWPAYAGHAWLAVLNQEGILVRRIQNIGGRALPGRQEVRRYYLVTSLADPAGVGLLLPVANLVRRVAATDGWRGLLAMKAVLLVPPGLSEAKRAQAAAALREVRDAELAGWPAPSAQELLIHPEEGNRHAFNSGCYIVEARHESRPECAPQTLDELETLTAEWLTYMAVGAIQSGLRQNDRLDEPHPPMGEVPTFSAFGLADFTVPTVAIADLCGRRLAKEMVESVLLAEPGEAGLDEAAAFVAAQGLWVATLKWNLPRAQSGMPLAQPFSASPELQWKGPESVARAWAFRERWERQDQPANMLGLTMSVQSRLAALVAPLRAEISRVLGRQPHGAFDRARAFLRELGRQVLSLRADVADEQLDLEMIASRLTSELAAEKHAMLEAAKTVGPVKRTLLVSTAAAATLLAVAFILSGLATFMGLAVAGAVATGLAVLNYLLQLLRLRRLLKGHLAKLRGYLDCIRRSHIAESVGSLLSGFEGKVVEALGRLAQDRDELAMWFATMPLDPGGVLNQTDRSTGHSYSGFRSRFSLATRKLIESIYEERGTGIAQAGPIGALEALASEFLAPPQGLPLWLERSPGDRIQQLLEFCRGRFATQVYESAEDLLVSKVLEYGRLPSSETSSRMQRELAENLLTMMRPTSSCLLLADEPDQVIGLEEAGPTLVNRAIEDLHLQQGLLQVIPTGLRHRVVGMAFRHGLTLEDLAAWPEYEQALEDFSDPNLLHTRLVFSGQKSETAVPPPPSPPPLPPPMPPPEPPPPSPESEWKAVPEADGADRPPPVDLPSCFRLLGLEPGASDEEVEDAYFVLKARYDPEMGREKDVDLMAQVNRAYDEIVLSRRQAA